MKKSILIFLFLSVIAEGTVYGAVTITGGPTIRIPGISSPTILQASGFNSTFPVRWTLNGAQVGGGNTFYATQAGNYFAQYNASTNPDNPFWINAGSITLAALSHNITVNGPNPLNQSTSTQLCITSNASAYITNRTWLRNGLFDVAQACKTVEHPGTFTATVTYVYGSQSSTLTVGAITISASLQAPTYQLSTTAYNPVTPPQLTVTNASAFTAFWLVFNDQPIVYQTTPTLVIPKPGRYSIGGLLGNRIVYSSDFRIIRKVSRDGYI